MQEVKAAKARSEKGEPPQSLSAASNIKKTTPEVGPRAGPGGSVAPTGMLGPTPLTAVQAMRIVLSMIPKDSKLGYMTADGSLVPLKLNNLREEHGAAERVVPAATVTPQPGALRHFSESHLPPWHETVQCCGTVGS